MLTVHYGDQNNKIALTFKSIPKPPGFFILLKYRMVQFCNVAKYLKCRNQKTGTNDLDFSMQKHEKFDLQVTVLKSKRVITFLNQHFEHDFL